MGRKIDPEDIVGKEFGNLKVLKYDRMQNKRRYYICACRCGRETVVERYNLLTGHTKACGHCTGKKADAEDIIGQRFGALTALDYEINKYGTYMYRCICECGRIQKVTRSRLKRGKTTKCAFCEKRKIDVEDIVGEKFGQLVVLSYSHFEDGQRFYLCRCDCGKERTVARSYLLSKSTTTCGDCTRIEKEEDHYRYYCHNGDSWIFDDDDLEFVKQHRWHITVDGYPQTLDQDGKMIKFHRRVLEVSESETVDHINGDTRDNRRANLRVAMQADNSRNQRLKLNNTSGYKGVSFNKNAKKYAAYINNEPYKRLHIGLFDTAEEAARAYDEAARFYFGQFACVNFPKEGEQCCRRNVS